MLYVGDRFEQAEADCTMAIEQDPTYNKAWLRRGMTKFRRGKYLSAIKDFEHALQGAEDEKQKKEIR